MCFFKVTATPQASSPDSAREGMHACHDPESAHLDTWARLRTDGYMCPASVATMTSSQRKDLFRRLMNDVILPQRQLLLQFRDHTWQSAHVDSDGSLGELIASIVTGERGRLRKGKGAGAYDLESGTEVKSSYRLDPNIDFVLEGTLRTDGTTRYLALTRVPDELKQDAILSQLNSNACSVQQIASNDPRTHALDTELARTVSANALVLLPSGRWRLMLTRNACFREIPDETSLIVCVRQERAHINFGDRSREQLDALFGKHPVFVHYTFDPMGRAQVAVLRASLTSTQRTKWLDEIFRTRAGKCQVQPYLFKDNVRAMLYTGGSYSLAQALRAQLLARGVLTKSGFDVTHWSPESPPLAIECSDIFAHRAPVEECGPFSHTPIELDLSNELSRQKAAVDFYQRGVLEYYEKLKEFCAATQTTRNIGFGNLAQHLVSLSTGLHGARSGARGADLLEADGSISEIKLATGEPTTNNPMASTDAPRLNLQANQAKMRTWKRLFPVRIVDPGDGLQVLVHAPSEETMKQFRLQVDNYFSQNAESTNLQYHALDAFPHDRYGVNGRTLEFSRVAWLRPSGCEFGAVP